MGNKFSSFKDFVPDESDICLLSDIKVGNSKRNKNDGNRNDGGLILYINESIPGKSINTYDFKGVSGIIVFEFSGSNKNAQLTFTCSKSAIETLEKGVKYIQS